MFNQRHYVESTLIQCSFTVLGRLSILLHKAVAFVKSGDGAGASLGNFKCRGRPSDLDKNRTMAYCACDKCEWGCLDTFLSPVVSFLSSSVGEPPDID